MANAYADPVSASQVGGYFVQQYYQIIQQQPDYTYQFYKDSSSIVRVDGGNTQSASSMQQINELIAPLNITAIEIKTINSLESWNGGLLVVVSGFLKSKNFSGWKKFLQTFFLAPQEKGFFVLNDVFHFVDDEAMNEAPAPASASAAAPAPAVSEAIHEPLPHLSENESDPEPPSSTVAQPEEPQDLSYQYKMEAREFVNPLPVEEEDEVQEYSLQEQQHQQEHSTVPEPIEEPSSFQQIAKDTVQEILSTHEEPVGDAPKLSYASILRAPKGSSTLPAASVHPSFPRSTPQPFVQQLNASSPAVNEASEDLPDGNLSHEEGILDHSSSFSSGVAKSIYVKNLPSSISTLEVLEEFKNFGKVKQDGVFLRNRQDGGACYAFVEFEDAQSAQNAVKASPIKMAGRPIFIEMRKPYINTTPRGGRRGGRGRGGRIGGRTSEFDNGSSGRVKSNGFRSSTSN